MRIQFKKIEIHNFKSFSDEVFEFDAHSGLNLVCGKNNDVPGSRNGSGKSALFSALMFSLFGQTQENIKNCNISNKYVDNKEVRVVTYFVVGEHSYKVVTGHNKYGSPYCQLSEIATSKDGKEDEIDLTKSTMTETRKFITDEILHCDVSIFLRTILLSSDQNYNFFRLKKWEKKEFIEKLFDISVFGEMYNLIHRDVLAYDKTMLQSQNKLMLLNKNNDEYVSRIKKHETDRSSKLKDLAVELEKLKSDKDQLKNLNINPNAAEVEKYEAAIDKVNDGIRKLDDMSRQLQSSISKSEVTMHKLKTSKSSKQSVIDKHSELMSKLCNDCKSIFADYYSISSYAADIQQINKKLAIEKEASDAASAKQSAVAEKSKLLSEKLVLLNGKIEKLTEDYNKASKKLAQLDAKVQAIESDMSKLEKQENPYAELQQSNLIELESEQKSLAALEEKYSYLKFAENIVSQDTLRKFIISDLVGLLNNKIKSYLTKFGAKYDVVFDSDMNYTFTTSGGQCEFDNFSSGERARLMIAACFAFRDFMYIRNSFSSNILILDEFIDGAIDSIAIESILEILKEFSDIWKQNIFVISHRKEVNNDVFNHIIQVVKTNNISKVTYIE